MPCATVYNNSFECVDAKTAALCRLAPANPKNSLAIPLTAQFTKETVTKMSFPAPCPTDKTLPIRPNAKSMLTQGLEHQMQSLTTQKHDFVPKCQGRRQKMVPVDKIKKRCGDVEHETTQKLSFMIPDTCHYTKAQSCKPQRFYKPPVCENFSIFFSILFILDFLLQYLLLVKLLRKCPLCQFVR